METCGLLPRVLGATALPSRSYGIESLLSSRASIPLADAVMTSSPHHGLPLSASVSPRRAVSPATRYPTVGCPVTPTLESPVSDGGRRECGGRRAGGGPLDARRRRQRRHNRPCDPLQSNGSRYSPPLYDDDGLMVDDGRRSTPVTLGGNGAEATSISPSSSVERFRGGFEDKDACDITPCGSSVQQPEKSISTQNSTSVVKSSELKFGIDRILNIDCENITRDHNEEYTSDDSSSVSGDSNVDVMNPSPCQIMQHPLLATPYHPQRFPLLPAAIFPPLFSTSGVPHNILPRLQQTSNRCCPVTRHSVTHAPHNPQTGNAVNNNPVTMATAATPLHVTNPFQHRSRGASGQPEYPGPYAALTSGFNGTSFSRGDCSDSKRKRSWSRAVFSSLQRKGLEKRFDVQKYVTKPDRRQLAALLGLTDAQVKVWFQNRRMKWRHTEDAKRNSVGGSLDSTKSPSGQTSSSSSITTASTTATTSGSTSTPSTNFPAGGVVAGENSPRLSAESNDEEEENMEEEMEQDLSVTEFGGAERLSFATEVPARGHRVSSSSITSPPCSTFTPLPQSLGPVNPRLFPTTAALTTTNTLTHFPPILQPAHLPLLTTNSPLLCGLKVQQLPPMLASLAANPISLETNGIQRNSHPLSDLYNFRKF